LIYPIPPKGFVAVGRERWTKRATDYFKWKQDCQKLGVEVPDAGCVVVFSIAMPKSWSKKKKASMLGKAHQQKPDLSNCIKAFEDAARYGQERGDQTIWHYGGLMKIWSENGSIEVRTP